MHRIVVASDSFKGCLSSLQVADSVQRGVRDVYPGCEVVKVAVADGGEGTSEAIAHASGGIRRTVSVSDPLGRPVDASYLICSDGTVIMEMSQASGLTLLQAAERNPMLTSTYGFGEMIADALDKGARRFIIGIGGSATNDAGIGMLEALGYRFTDKDGHLLKACGASLSKVSRIDFLNVNPYLKEAEFMVACDVDSPFCGPDGAAYVYAPQKGATPEMVVELDAGMRHFAEILSQTESVGNVDSPGAGAAGGLGGALKAFLKAEIRRGADIVLDAVGFDDAVKDADLVITGEGRIDSQTMTGKLPYVVAERAASRNIPVVAICGCAEVDALPMFQSICPVTPADMPMSSAMDPQTASMNIRDTVRSLLTRNIND